MALGATEHSDPAVSAPFSPGTVMLGLHLSAGDAREAVRSLREQAVAAERAGFDGIGLSEHHGGFPGYAPTPIVLAGALVAATERIWGAPCPTVLPLRPSVVVVEDLAWLAACYPGRIGAAFVSGYQSGDFELVGADFEHRMRAFADALPAAVRALAGDPALTGGDPAVSALGTTPVPVLAGAGGPRAARRAALAGAGLLLTSLTDPGAARELVDTYAAEGGTGPRVLIRRVWLGPPPSFAEQMDAYRAADPEATLPGVEANDVMVSGSADDVAARLARDCEVAGADALNLRIFVPDATSADLVDQIERVGAEVLPALRRALDWRPHGAEAT